MTFCTPVHSEQHLHLHGHSCHESWRGTHQIHNYTTSYYDPTGWGRKDYIRRLTKTFKLFTWSLTSNQCTLSHRRHHRMCGTEQMGWTLWCGQEHGTQECCCPVLLPPSCHSTQRHVWHVCLLPLTSAGMCHVYSGTFPVHGSILSRCSSDDIN